MARERAKPRLERLRRAPTAPVDDRAMADDELFELAVARLQLGDDQQVARARCAWERALELLPEDFRMVVLLVDAQEFSYEEAAAALSVPTGTVMSRLHRGRKMLQKVLVEQGRALGLAKAEAMADSTPPASLEAFREKKLRGTK